MITQLVMDEKSALLDMSGASRIHRCNDRACREVSVYCDAESLLDVGDERRSTMHESRSESIRVYDELASRLVS